MALKLFEAALEVSRGERTWESFVAEFPPKTDSTLDKITKPIHSIIGKVGSFAAENPALVAALPFPGAPQFAIALSANSIGDLAVLPFSPEFGFTLQSLAPGRAGQPPPFSWRDAVPVLIDIILDGASGVDKSTKRNIDALLDGLLRNGRASVDDAATVMEVVFAEISAPPRQRVESIGDNINFFANGFTNPVSNFTGGTVAKIEEFLSTQLEQLTDFVTSVIDRIGEGISTSIESIERFVQAIVEGFVQAITGAFERALGALRDMIAKISTGLSELIADISQRLGRAVESLIGGVRNLVDDARIFIQRAIDKVTSTVSIVVDRIANLIDIIRTTFANLIDQLLASSRAIISKLTDVLLELPGAIRGLGDLAVSAFEEFIGKPLTALPEALQKQIAGALNDIASEDTARVAQAGQFAYFGTITAQDSREQFRKLFTETLPEQPIIRYIVQTLLAVFILFQLGSGMAQAQSQLILQEFSLNTPAELLRAGDSIRALHFGEIDRETAVLNIRRSGFTEDDANRLINTGETVPTETDLLRWWLRGIIDDTEVDRRFEGRGYNSAERERFREAAFFIPPVADLISMAVREAFSPEVAERFGQFEDFPAPFAEAAAKQGVSDEWARRYWAAHWGLPSVQMGFEMLHRGVIGSEDLNLLLRAQDIMPFWRDKLTQISFSPLTRVDVRRMHKLGVLSRDEVKRSYSDLGYNDENAERLTAFTVELNAPRVAEDDTELSQLSRGAILGLFEDGIIDRDRAKLLMVGVGVSDDAAELFLDSKEMDIERADRGDQKALIIEQAKVGQLSFQEAQDALASLGLETVEQERAIVKLVRQEASKTRLPTRANLDDFLEAELIDEAEYIETMARLGFTRKWTDRFLGLIKGG